MNRRWKLLPFVLAAASGFASTWARAQQTPESNRYGYGPYMMMDWTGGWYGMIFGPLFMLLALGVAVAIAIIIVRGLGGPPHWAQPHQMPPGRTPVDILKERYARGEIDRQEFEERRRVLGD
jgi:putative membrane protein